MEENLIKDNGIYNYDALDFLHALYEDYGDESIDMFLCDLPYTFKGKNRVTANKWDLPIDDKEFFDIARGLEDLPERSERCYKCYELRLKETAKVAEELGFKYFATTLTLSPYKDSNWLNEIGERLDKDFSSTYLYSDFKKKNGYKRSIELSKEYDMYRQDYCGCVYSKRDYLERIKDK